jgi:hypothetical protein
MWVGSGPAAARGRTTAGVALVAGLLVAGAALAQGAGTVSGRVTDELGHPLPGITLTLYPDGPSTVTGEDGRFEVTAPAGNYLLRYTWDNRTWEVAVEVSEGNSTDTNLTARVGNAAGSGLDPFPFVFLAVAMVAVIAGGFYVNKRMSETGLAFDKSVMGGVPARKPFRRRRKRAGPPKSP